MPLFMTVGENKKDQPNVKTIENFPGANRPIYVETSYEGLVLSQREKNGYDDSDFYATVWDLEKGEPKEIMWGTTRAWTYANGCTVDATPEVKEAYQAYQDARIASRDARAATKAREYEKIADTMARPGDFVRVFKGRKVPKGTEGHITWQGSDGFGNTKVGIKDAEGKVHYTAVSNCEIKMPQGWVADTTKLASTFLEANWMVWSRFEGKWRERPSRNNPYYQG